MSDQNFFKSQKWGRLTFVPTKDDRWKNTCRHCPLWVPRQAQSLSDECLDAPCSPGSRTDGRRGYFAIQNFPVQSR